MARLAAQKETFLFLGATLLLAVSLASEILESFEQCGSNTVLADLHSIIIL